MSPFTNVSIAKGNGSGAILRPVINDGKITDVIEVTE